MTWFLRMNEDEVVIDPCAVSPGPRAFRRGTRWRTAGLLPLLTVLAACSVPPTLPEPGKRAAAGSAALPAPGRAVSHALEGVIWDVRGRSTLSDTQLAGRLAGARFVLLGELHDNPEHHRWRVRLVEAMHARNPDIGIAMEQIDRERQGALDAAIGSGAGTKALLQAIGAIGSGWQWEHYEPFLDLAVTLRLPLVGANLSRARAREVVAGGHAALGPARSEVLGIDAVWTPRHDGALRAEIVASHCGIDPGTMLPGLVAAQRARDAEMADAMVGMPARLVVMLAGNGHVRRDRGVPLYLAHREPASAGAIVSVGLVEVEPGRDRADLYEAASAAAPVYDVLRFTPVAVRDDPCRALRERGSLRPKGS